MMQMNGVNYGNINYGKLTAELDCAVTRDGCAVGPWTAELGICPAIARGAGTVGGAVE